MSTLSRRSPVRESSPQVKPSALRLVSVLDWAYAVLAAGAAAAPNHRVLAIALLNEDSLLGRMFTPPAPEWPAAPIDPAAEALTEVRAGRASALPKLDGAGLSKAELARIWGARNEAEWSAARWSENGSKIEAEGRTAGLAELRTLLDGRAGGEPPAPEPVLVPFKPYQPTDADRSWWATFTNGRACQCRKTKVATRRNNHVPSNRAPEDYTEQEISEFGSAMGHPA